MINNYSTLSPLICNAKKSSFVSSRTMPFTEEDYNYIRSNIIGKTMDGEAGKYFLGLGMENRGQESVYNI